MARLEGTGTLNTKGKISIAMCTFNGTRFLSEQLASILAQSRLPDELVIGDDRSSDETLEVLARFSESAPFPVRITVNENNLGSTANFESTIKRCEGDIIFLCDQDDIWDSKKIEIMAAEFERSDDAGMVFSNARLIDDSGRDLGETLWDHAFRPDEQQKASQTHFYSTLLKRNVVTGAAMAFRSRYLPDILPIPTHLPNTIHDGWIAIVVSTLSRVIFLDQCLIEYRQHAGQQLGIGNEVRVGGTQVQRFSQTISFLRKQKEFLGMLDGTIENYPALLRVGDLQKNVTASVSEIDEYIEHLERRISLLSDGRRVRKALAELRTGRYHRFSRGALSAVKDILGK